MDRWEVYQGRRQHKVYWEAQWPIGNGRSRHRKFSILKYGEEGAYQRALRPERLLSKRCPVRRSRHSNTKLDEAQQFNARRIQYSIGMDTIPPNLYL